VDDLKKVAIVVQRCHQSIVGGAENEAWQWAQLLRNDYQVEILTTTALDAATWSNVLSPGVEHRDGLTIRRFSVDQERTPYWHSLHRLLLEKFEQRRSRTDFPAQKPALSWSMALQEEFIYRQGPYCADMMDFLRRHSCDYSAVIFMTYLFPTTYFGMQQVPRDRCLLVPTLHDEAPAYLAAYKYMARRACKVLWNTSAERDLGASLWGELPGRLVGMGINCREYAPAQPGYPYLLYSGRIDPFKGSRELVDYFTEYKRQYPSELRLILTGKDELGLPAKPDIEFKGFVSEEEKFELMAGALVFVMSSPHESLSVVSLEAMAQGTPVLANGRSLVMADHILGSQGGLTYKDYSMFAGAVNVLLHDQMERSKMGNRARKYVVSRYSFASIHTSLLAAINASNDLQ
jgi:glycosyltransferase involved in cell wall biosynthesis